MEVRKTEKTVAIEQQEDGSQALMWKEKKEPYLRYVVDGRMCIKILLTPQDGVQSM